MENEYISKLKYDGQTRSPFAHDLITAISDLEVQNYFSIPALGDGPYEVQLKIRDNRLQLDANGHVITIALRPFQKILKDYFIICESYQQSLLSHSHDRVEAIDMGRRGMHNEGAEVLIEALEGKANLPGPCRRAS